MQLKETEFGFRLLAENNPRKRTYNFVYQADKNQWQFLGAAPESGE
jgi:hypothetical protein